jgi:hypothetical protein
VSEVVKREEATEPEPRGRPTDKDSQSELRAASSSYKVDICDVMETVIHVNDEWF